MARRTAKTAALFCVQFFDEFKPAPLIGLNAFLATVYFSAAEVRIELHGGTVSARSRGGDGGAVLIVSLPAN